MKTFYTLFILFALVLNYSSQEENIDILGRVFLAAVLAGLWEEEKREEKRSSPSRRRRRTSGHHHHRRSGRGSRRGRRNSREERNSQEERGVDVNVNVNVNVVAGGVDAGGERYVPPVEDPCYWLTESTYIGSPFDDYHRIKDNSKDIYGDYVKELIERCEAQFIYHLDNMDMGHTQRIVDVYDQLKKMEEEVRLTKFTEYKKYIEYVEALSPYVNIKFYKSFHASKSLDYTIFYHSKSFRKYAKEEFFEYLAPICKELGTPEVHSYRDLFTRQDEKLLLRKYMGDGLCFNESVYGNRSESPRKFLIEMEENFELAFSSEFRPVSNADRDFVKYFWPDFDDAAECFDTLQKHRETSARLRIEVLRRANEYKEYVQSYGRSEYRLGPFRNIFLHHTNYKIELLKQRILPEEFHDYTFLLKPRG